jgi:hypothetical protein
MHMLCDIKWTHACYMGMMRKAEIAAYFKALHESLCTENEYFSQDNGFRAENRIPDLQNTIQNAN